MMTSPACDSTSPMTLQERWAPDVMIPIPNWSCEWRGNACSVNIVIASMPGNTERCCTTLCVRFGVLTSVPVYSGLQVPNRLFQSFGRDS